MKLQKETKTGSTASRSDQPDGHGKWYDDACGTAFAMELVGERWSLLIIRELMLGGRRFSDLRRVLPAISAKVLTERLSGLESAGVLVKRQLAPPAPAQIYELTEWGYFAEPAIQELGRWAARSAAHNPRLPLTPVGLMLSMRTMLDREGAKAFDATVGFDVGGESFVAQLKDGELTITRGDPSTAQVTFHAPVAPVIAGAIYADIPFEELEGVGLVVDGDRELGKRYFSLFELPPKIG